MIFKILLETNLQIVFWSVFNPIKAPVIAWFIIDFLQIIKNKICIKLNACGYGFL